MSITNDIRSITDSYGNVRYFKSTSDELHREDGPAIIWNQAYNNWHGHVEEWYLNDRFYKRPEQMPLNLFLAYCKWEYKKNGK